MKTEIAEEDVKVKMACCPECGNPSLVAVEHCMTRADKNAFAKEVMAFDLQVKTIPLAEYREKKVQMYCDEDCPRSKT